MNGIIRQIVSNTVKPAFLIGNGINLYADLFPSWDKLLARLSTSDFGFPTDGISYTELYDLIDLQSHGRKDLKISVMSELISLNLTKLLPHRKLMTYANENKMPVLTTNFDFCTSKFSKL